MLKTLLKNATQKTSARTPSSKTGSSGSLGFEHWYAKTFDFGTKKRVRLYRRMQRFTERGHDLDKTIRSIRDRYARDKDMRKSVFSRIHRKMQSGEPFHRSVGDYIPVAERMIIFSGEETSKIPEAFDQAAYVADAIRRIRSALVSELTYPTVLVVAAVVIAYFITIKFLPLMIEMSPDVASWPVPSRTLYAIGTFVDVAGGYFVVTVFVVGFIALRTMPTWTTWPREFFDRWIPPYTLYREYQASVFLITMSSLVQAGRPLDYSIRIIHRISNRWMQQHLMIMMRSLDHGVSSGQAFKTGLLDPESEGDIEDYANAGAIGEALTYVGMDALEDGIERIRSRASKMKVLGMLLVAGIILTAYTGMMFLVMDVAMGVKGSVKL